MSIDKDIVGASNQLDADAGGCTALGRCFSGGRLELAMEVGRPLEDLDPEKLKSEIRRWAKAVVAYARQLSFCSVVGDDQ